MDHTALYERWTSAMLEDADLTAELAAIKGRDEEILTVFTAIWNLGRSDCAACWARGPTA